jgi:hypothetical protein
MRTDPDSVKRWLLHLMTMASPAMTNDRWSAIEASYVPGLCKRFDARVFCRGSVEHVAAECRHWPTYAVLIDHLRAWVTENPDPLAIAHDRGDGLKPADRRWVNYWHKRTTEGFRNSDSSAPQNLAEARANCLSLIRAQSMPAYVEINGPDHTATERDDGWHDRAALQRTIDRLDYDDAGQPSPHPRRAEMLGHLRRMMAHAAPDMLGMLPPVVAGEEREDRQSVPDMRMRTGLAASRPFHTPGPSVESITRSRSDDLAHLAMLKARAASTASSEPVRRACAQTAHELEARLMGEEQA